MSVFWMNVIDTLIVLAGVGLAIAIRELLDSG
jgi:hypothetical protein